MGLLTGGPTGGRVVTMLSGFLTASWPEGIGLLTWWFRSPRHHTTGSFQDLPWNWPRVIAIILLVMLYSDSKAGKTDSTSQCEEYQSGQLSSITEEVRKVGRRQILWAVAGYGRCYSECDGMPLKGFEQRMTRPNLCFT